MTDIVKDQVIVEEQEIPATLPLLALRDVVVYPHMQIALFVGREKSINAVEIARNSDNLVFVVAQKDSLTEDIDHNNLYQYGTVARIVQVVNHENDDNCIKVLIECTTGAISLGACGSSIGRKSIGERDATA